MLKSSPVYWTSPHVLKVEDSPRTEVEDDDLSNQISRHLKQNRTCESDPYSLGIFG